MSAGAFRKGFRNLVFALRKGARLFKKSAPPIRGVAFFEKSLTAPLALGDVPPTALAGDESDPLAQPFPWACESCGVPLPPGRRHTCDDCEAEADADPLVMEDPPRTP